MNKDCQRLAEDLSAHSDGELRGAAAAELSAHLDGCAHCRAELERTRKLTAHLKAALGSAPVASGIVETLGARARALAGGSARQPRRVAKGRRAATY